MVLLSWKAQMTPAILLQLNDQKPHSISCPDVGGLYGVLSELKTRMNGFDDPRKVG
jgi:hypothetical protein